MEISKCSGFKITDFTDTVDVRDGLNPALRKLFFSLKTKLLNDKFKNSYRVLKDIFGDRETAFELIYDLLVNTMWPRCDLVFFDGKGNFGFPPAYPYFSEMKLSSFGEGIIGRAEGNDVDLPFAIPVPYVLVCGTLGYCRGEVKIPTHNLGEIIDAMIALVKNADLETKDLLQFIKGPDLLIGGAIENSEELCSIYEKGFGNIKVIVTPQNFDAYFIDSVKDYCDWYKLKVRKVYKKEAYRIELPYCALLNDGEKNELMSIKKILKKNLEYFRVCYPELSDNDLCKVLTHLKRLSSIRKTHERV